jgi:putative MATE family efflux protein
MEIALADKTKIPISQLVLPMFIENVIRTSLLSVDQLMLYSYSEKAVAALGVVNQMTFFIQIIYMMVAIGTSIIISQNLGAGQKNEARFTGLASIFLISIFSIILSTIIVLSASPILNLYTLEPEVRHYAWQFLVIYGGGSIFMALNLVQANILRAYGYSKDAMIVNVIALLFTISGNCLCLFGFFGFPIMGVKGVASVTVLSQFLAFWIMGLRIYSRKEINLPYRKIFKIPGYLYNNILKIGIPTAGENLSYNVSQIFITWIIAGMGTSYLAAYSLVITLSRYVFISGISIGSGTQIKVGYFVGSNKQDEAHHRVYKYFAVGLMISVIMVLILNIFKYHIIGIFTKNPEITMIASSVFFISFFLEPARNFNTIINPGLKGAGDIKFPVIIGLIFMWIVGAGGAYLLGVEFKMGLTGIWIAMASDEWIRGIIMFFRWKSGAWKNRSLIKHDV